MTATSILSPEFAEATRIEPPARPVAAIRALDGPAIPGSLFATWRRRIGFRRDLERLAKAGPYLIDDIGLTMAQVEAELGKPFWRR